MGLIYKYTYTCTISFLFYFVSADDFKPFQINSRIQYVTIRRDVNMSIVKDTIEAKSLLRCSAICTAQLSASLYFTEEDQTCHCNNNADSSNDNDPGKPEVTYGQFAQLTQISKQREFTKWDTIPRQADCLDLYNAGFSTDGVYTIKPAGQEPVDTWCDMQNRGWTVFQRRLDGSEDFYRGWSDYVSGFGNKTGEFWLGLDNIHTLVEQDSELYIYMEAFDGMSPESAFGRYSLFSLQGPSQDYRITVGGFEGSCDDPFLWEGNNTAFATFDRDSYWNCSSLYRGAWWYGACHGANPNGYYYGGTHESTADGVNWLNCWGNHYSVNKAAMKAKRKFPKWNTIPRRADCLDLYNAGNPTDGVYTIKPVGQEPVDTWCDMQNGGWTVFQRRLDGSEDFYRGWSDYVSGFGNKTGEFWLGLDNIHALVEVDSELYIYMEAFDGMSPGSAFGRYSLFSLQGPSQDYRITVGGFEGSCDDPFLWEGNNTAFATFDRDSYWNCSSLYRGAWWYGACHGANPNGYYYGGTHDSTADGVNWLNCWGNHYSVKKAAMKVKRKFTKWDTILRRADCLDLYNAGYPTDGVYTIKPAGQEPVDTWCDMQNGGWTVFQRRLDGSEDFYRGWSDYVSGFGNKTGEFWLGLDNIHALVEQESELYIYMEAFDGMSPGSAFGRYSVFNLQGPSQDYRITVGGFEGSCNDPFLWEGNNTAFATFDRDSYWNCTSLYRGAWWYGACHGANPNGYYYGGTHDSTADGVNWLNCWGNHYSVKKAALKVRRVSTP